MHYFIGFLFILAGIGLIVKTEWVVENFGTSSWAEEKLGTSGGSRIFYKLIGLALIFIGMLLVTNMMTGFLNATIGKILVR